MLVLLNVGAIFMGTALTIRDLIGERAIFLREQAVGLSTTAYLLAKVVVFAGVRARAVGDRRRHQRRRQELGPRRGDSGAVIPPRTLELYVDIAGLLCARR